MYLNKKYLFYAAIVAAVVIGYFFIGELAFGGLAAMLFSPKTAIRKGDDAEAEANVYDEQGEAQREDVKEILQAVEEKGKENQAIANEITQPKDSPKPGTTRKRWTVE